jgi:Mrp family chromosome partitioning ATPase
MKEAATKYQQVVIDSAPVNEASETLLLASQVQAACLIIRANRTPISAVSRACQLLEMAGRPPLGFVLNGVSRRLPR